MVKLKDSSFAGATPKAVRTIKVTDTGVRLYGTRNDEQGRQSDFVGTLTRKYTNLIRASTAARRKYKDPTISVLRVEPYSVTYEVPVDRLSEIAVAITQNNG